ncbi:hypothetical protein BT69DRAFT_1288566 [Atractiella rhizophila]|nr:hypothetical protein BT69DRAFT_1288566 [Atractiella rhizophila]
MHFQCCRGKIKGAGLLVVHAIGEQLQRRCNLKEPNHLSLLRNFLLTSTVVSSSIPSAKFSPETLINLRAQRREVRRHVEEELEEWAAERRLTGAELRLVEDEKVEACLEMEGKLLKRDLVELEERVEELRQQLESVKVSLASGD